MGDKLKPTKSAKEAVKSLIKMDKEADKKIKKAGK